MNLSKHIIITSIVAIMLMHTAIPHSHYSKSDTSQMMENSPISSLVDILGLGFHNSGEKNLNESNQVSYDDLDFTAQETTLYPVVVSQVVDIEQSSALIDYQPLFIKHYKYSYSNNLPLRAPPREII
jgi:hypothetical protein